MSGTQILQPDVSITLTRADRDVSNKAQKVLIVGQMLAAGSATSGELQSDLATTGAPEDVLFGRSSQIAAMIRAFRKINQFVQVDAIGLDDAGGGVPRVVAITIVGTATEAGTLVVVAGSETLHRYEVAVASGDDPTAIAVKIVAAVNADTTCPFTASNVAGVVSLTADNDGTVANDLGVETSGSIAGVTGMAVSETTPGATDPTLTGILDVATDRYQGVVWPYAATTVLTTYLDARWNPANAILDGVGFVTVNDTYANHFTVLGSLNFETLVYFCDKSESETNYLGPAQNEPSYSKSAMFAAIRALRLTTDAPIARYLTSSASLDQFGGTALASLPYFNTPMPDLPTIKPGRGWTQAEIAALDAAGGSVMGVNSGGTGALIGEVKTTYKTDPASNDDVTFGFLNYVDTASNVREYFFNNLKARFAQARLTAGAVSRGRDMANGTVIRAYLEKLYQDLAGADFVLVQDGEAALKYFKDNLTVTLDLSLGKVTITALTPIVTQLRTIIYTVKIAFSTEG